jgi:vacuolar-type H+-ATPase subunit H
MFLFPRKGYPEMSKKSELVQEVKSKKSELVQDVKSKKNKFLQDVKSKKNGLVKDVESKKNKLVQEVKSARKQDDSEEAEHHFAPFERLKKVLLSPFETSQS